MDIRKQHVAAALVLTGLAIPFLRINQPPVIAKEHNTVLPRSGYLGSSECRSCHERFYELWAPSHHGLAMQPYTPEFAAKQLTPHEEDITIGKAAYRVVTTKTDGYVLEKSDNSERKYPIEHALGGKNTYYFLTSLDRGRLQVLPLAYDVNRQSWYDTAASAVRHFPDREDEAIHWTDRPYTFNTSCYGCHVSQLVKNYDAETDSYHTEWKEPGINCETCHGPAAEHVKVCKEAAAKGEEPNEMKLVTITQGRGYSPHQVDTACSTCHAKMVPLTAEFSPGDDFFQHYDLVTLEHPDYYPDGRDLGENYTYTSWRMSPCVKASKLDCLYCHTSSGRYRFTGSNANKACTTCHKDKAKNLRKHTHHNPNKVVNQCIQCHMPKTEFGRMIRSDHSMRPPMPSATLKYKSPNACNLCHTRQDAAWADKQVRRWHNEDYQKETLEIAALVDAARKNQWDQLDQMLVYLKSKDRDEIFANSLVRLMRNCPDEKKWAVLTELFQCDPSPLIRGSIAGLLQDHLNKKTLPALLKAINDPYHLVRIRAAATLAAIPDEQIPEEHRKSLSKAMNEYRTAMMARPDDASSHYNLGNYFQNRGLLEDAISSFETSWKLQKDFTPAYVNASLVYNTMGENEKAVACLKKAIQYEPKNTPAHLNLALLYGEMKRYGDAEKAFQKVYELDPKSAVAAYNLGVLLGQEDAEKAAQWIKKAYNLEPKNSKYAYTLAYYYAQQNRVEKIIEVLQPLVDDRTDNANIYLMLADTYVQMNQTQKAIEIFQIAADNPQLNLQARQYFQDYIQGLMLK